jgi:hypothetical protein
VYFIVYKKCYDHFYIYKIRFEDLIDKYSFSDNNLYLKIECEDLS